MTYFLGVDGGASKTAALVTDDTGKNLGDGVAGPSNHLRVGIETAARNIERAVNKALVTADVASREIVWAYCGIAGADHPAHRQEIVDSLNIFFPRGNFSVDNDARIALTGAIGFGAGVVVIAGTGSVAFGRNEAGEETRAGATKMLEILSRDYQFAASEIPRFVYATTTHADDIARYSKLVIEAAEAEDPVASAILQDAGRELGACVVAVAQRLKLADREFPVAYVGGAFNAGELLLAPMRRTVTEKAPIAKIGEPQRTPVEGAAMMAIRAAAAPRPTRSRA